MRIRPIVLIPLALAGCVAPRGEFPSLAVRPIESRGDAIAIPPSPTAAADPAVAIRSAALANEIDAAARAFDAAVPPATRAAERAGPAGSEGWIAAQLALNTLVRERARVADALRELDALLVDDYAAARMVAPAVVASAERARSLSDAQAATIDALTRRLGD